MKYNKFEGHTPGPWENSNGLDAIVFKFGKSNPILFRGCSMSGSEKEPNMELAAAAPDLLARCKGLEKMLRKVLDASEEVCMGKSDENGDTIITCCEFYGTDDCTPENCESAGVFREAEDFLAQAELSREDV